MNETKWRYFSVTTIYHSSIHSNKLKIIHFTDLKAKLSTRIKASFKPLPTFETFSIFDFLTVKKKKNKVSICTF